MKNEINRYPQIIVVIGRSGSGKTTLARMLGEKMNCEDLGFSYAGTFLARENKDSPQFMEINNYICECIINAVNRCGQVIVDGLASWIIAERLRNAGYSMLVLYLNTPYKLRIERIAERENCSIYEAYVIEKDKARGKEKAGLDTVINIADFVLDGKEKLPMVLSQAEECINAFILKKI